MRSGAQGADDESTRQFKAQSQRLMGDMNDAGDAPFGGEMQVDSQVGHSMSPFCCLSATFAAVFQIQAVTLATAALWPRLAGVCCRYVCLSIVICLCVPRLVC